MDKNEAALFEQKLKNLKIFQMFVLVIAIGAVALCSFSTSSLSDKIKANEKEITQLEEKLEDMQTYLGYEEGKNSKIDDEQLAKEFMETNYVKTNSLGKETTKEDLFNKSDAPYYVMFHMDGCAHCIEVESKLQKYVDKAEALPIYFYDANNITEDTPIQWAEEDDEPNYQPTSENFELVGTPTLLKVENGKAIAFIGVDGILAELVL